MPIWVFKGALLLAAAIWGMGTVVIKSTVDELSPSWIVGVRFLGAGIILGALSFPKVIRSVRQPGTHHLHHGIVLGVFVFLSYWCNSTGLADTTASNSSFLTTLYVVIIPLISWFIIQKLPTRFNLVAATLCMIGVGFVAYGGSEGGFSLRGGDLITMASAVFLSFHVLYTAKYAPGHSMTTLTVIQFLVAGVLGVIAACATGPLPDLGSLSAQTWISLVYLTVFASCAALGLQNAAVARVDPAQAALFLATECLFGGAFSVILLGETVSATSGIGFALIFCGIVVSEYMPLLFEKRAKGRLQEDGGSSAAQVAEAQTARDEDRAMEDADAFMR